MLAGFASSAGATIVYVQSHDVGNNTWLGDLYSMTDTGTSQAPLVTATDLPSGFSVNSLSSPSVLPAGSTLAFSGTNNEYCTQPLGGCGYNYDSIYTLAGGAVTQISPAVKDVGGVAASEDPSHLTADGRVIYEYTFVDFGGSPPTPDYAAETLNVAPLSPTGSAGGTGDGATQWVTQKDLAAGNWPSISSNFAPDPIDGSLLAYFTDFYASPGDTLWIGSQTNTNPIDVTTDPGQSAVAWSPSGAQLAVLDEFDSNGAARTTAIARGSGFCRRRRGPTRRSCSPTRLPGPRSTAVRPSTAAASPTPAATRSSSPPR
jgi:hypothetical protein